MISDRKSNPETHLDLSGLKCPLPALRTRKFLKTMQGGESLRVICTDPLTKIDIPHLVRETGDVLEDQREESGKLIFVIRRHTPL